MDDGAGGLGSVDRREDEGSERSATSSSNPGQTEPVTATTDVLDSNEPPQPGPPERGQSSPLTPEMMEILSKCAKCEKTLYFGQGRLLDCFHVACTTCIRERLRHDMTLACPKCFHRTSVRRHFADLPQDRLPTLGLSVKQPDEPRYGGKAPSGDYCEDCTDMESRQEAATCWCADCEGKFCKDHGQQHSKRRVSKGHTIIGLKMKADSNIAFQAVSTPQHAATTTRDDVAARPESESTAPPLPSRADMRLPGDLLALDFTSTCSLHLNEQLRYCPECEDLLCAICREISCCTHDTAVADEALRDVLPGLVALLSHPEPESAPDQCKALNAVVDRIATIQADAETISEEVQTTFAKHKKALDDKMKQVLQDLNEIKWKNLVPLEEQRNRLEDVCALRTRAYQLTRIFEQPESSRNPLVILRMVFELKQVAAKMAKICAEEPIRHPQLAFVQRDKEKESAEMWRLIKQMGYAADLETYPAHFFSKLKFLQKAKYVGEETVVSIQAVDSQQRPVKVGSYGNKADDWTVSFNFNNEQTRCAVVANDKQYPGVLVSRFRNQASPGVFSVTATYKMVSVQNSLAGRLQSHFRFGGPRTNKELEISEDGLKVTNPAPASKAQFACGRGQYVDGLHAWTLQVTPMWTHVVPNPPQLRVPPRAGGTNRCALGVGIAVAATGAVYAHTLGVLDFQYNVTFQCTLDVTAGSKKTLQVQVLSPTGRAPSSKVVALPDKGPYVPFVSFYEERMSVRIGQVE